MRFKRSDVGRLADRAGDVGEVRALVRSPYMSDRAADCAQPVGAGGAVYAAPGRRGAPVDQDRGAVTAIGAVLGSPFPVFRRVGTRAYWASRAGACYGFLA